MFKVLYVVLLAVFLYGSSCQTSQAQASRECVAALAGLGISIASGVNMGGTFDLSSVLALILANGGDISAAVGACSAVFMAQNSTDLKSVVKAKADALPAAQKEMKASAAPKIPYPTPPIKVRIR